jgi:stage II sporulation protein E
MCRKSGRFLAELHRSQEQLRSIHADRQRQQEYRAAVIQQYQFLGQFLRELADRLGTRVPDIKPFYAPQVQVCGNRPPEDNGDRVLQFHGTMCKYYIVLCDGMGTGLGAIQEGRTAAGMLRSLLTAGFPAEYALRSMNSLCALRDRAGAATVDLAEVELYSGKVTVYKWGAAPSYLVSAGGAERIGAASPPPGLSVEQDKEQAHSFSMRRGQTLVLVSDGVGEEAARQCCINHADRSPGELARSILTCAQVQGQDDATVVTLRLGLAGENT